jgi:periplasmic protein CpxP/Spy
MNHLHTSTTRALKTPFTPRLKFALGTGLVVLAASLVPTARATAQTDDNGARHSLHQARHAAMHDRAPMGGMGGMDMGLGGGRHAEKLLDSVGATPEQKAQIRQISEAARADVKAQHEAHAGLRDQARTLMTQPNIDANAVEAWRQQMLAQHDQVSKRMTQAMVDIGRVLTPDQRQALAERMSKRQEMMKKRRAERMGERAPAR